MAAREAHNLKVGGSNPPPATSFWLTLRQNWDSLKLARRLFFYPVSPDFILGILNLKSLMDDKTQNINISELSSAIAQVCDEKGISRDKVLETVEAALAAAYKKDYGKKGQIIKAKFNSEAQTASFYQVKEVVDETTRVIEIEKEKDEDAEEEEPSESVDEVEDSEEEDALPRFNKERDILLPEAKTIDPEAKIGDELSIALASENQFGRVAAQNAKQVIIQKLREAEREALYEEFKNKVGEVVTATVQRVENRNVYLDLGKMVGVLYPSEQVQRENYRTGQRIRVYVEKINKDAKDTSVTLSRSNPNLVSRLFSLEVPEIFAGTVVIKSIAREPGSRSKIAVQSLEEGIDPIGSCVGQKGTRVQAIIDELGGEKIDIIEFNEDPRTFITHALSPAKVRHVEIDEAERKATAFVDSDQLSLAIGKRGQNVRLAAKLSDWKIDVVAKEKEVPVAEELPEDSENSEEGPEDETDEIKDSSPAEIEEKKAE